MTVSTLAPSTFFSSTMLPTNARLARSLVGFSISKLTINLTTASSEHADINNLFADRIFSRSISRLAMVLQHHYAVQITV
ncbi:hypothetical protein [endosymbiont of Lamellibrachia barhami]|uniref:hypothetical protein n=1 Tax=endosymbiont of Lamellibrachia barhami TaxID=205975 RepID=UPI0015B1DCB6|nr:hypothetical protein [endosymbiont of Lamellibrachia barhami]